MSILLLVAGGLQTATFLILANTDFWYVSHSLSNYLLLVLTISRRKKKMLLMMK